MSLTEALPYHQGTEGRISDLFWELEQGRPLAVRLAGETTAGQTCYSEEPYSTWGFNPLGHPPTAVNMRSCLGNYVATLVIQRVHHRHLGMQAVAAKEAVIGPWTACPGEKPQVSWSWHHAAGMHPIRAPHELWPCQEEHVSTTAPTQGQSEPVVSVDLADYLEPPSLEWDRSDSKAAEMARTFSEDLYADH